MKHVLVYQFSGVVYGNEHLIRSMFPNFLISNDIYVENSSVSILSYLQNSYVNEKFSDKIESFLGFSFLILENLFFEILFFEPVLETLSISFHIETLDHPLHRRQIPHLEFRFHPKRQLFLPLSFRYMIFRFQF